MDCPEGPGHLRPPFPGRGDGGGWSGGCGQGAQPLPAGQERLLPGPGAADLQHALPDVADQPGGQAQQPVASLNSGDCLYLLVAWSFSGSVLDRGEQSLNVAVVKAGDGVAQGWPG